MTIAFRRGNSYISSARPSFGSREKSTILKKGSERSTEAGLKYFVLGALSSGMLLYGASMVYGFAGTTSFAGLATAFAGSQGPIAIGLIVGLVFVIAGLAFKVSAVPFHMWTPDVYQGAPTPVTAFMSSATKAAGFAALLRVLGVAFPLYSTDWRPAIWALAALSLIVGSVAAIVQTDVKRILAYSSISHAGYILIGFQADTARGRQAALIYLLVYAFMTVGAFAVITVWGARGPRHHWRHRSTAERMVTRSNGHSKSSRRSL